MTTLSTPATPTNVAPPAAKLAKSDRARLENLAADLHAIDLKIVEIDNLRGAVRLAACQYARGETPLELAIALAGIEPGRIAACRGALRSGVKQFQRELIASVSDLVKARREAVAADLAEKCRTVEASERATAESVGIDPDSFAPSDLLAGLREQLRRAVRAIDGLVTRGDFNELSRAAGIELPRSPFDENPEPLGEVADEVETGPAPGPDGDAEPLAEAE